MSLTQEIFHLQNMFSFHKNMNKYTAYFLTTPCKWLLLDNSVAKWDLNLQVVQAENLAKHGLIQLKIYMDLHQICQVFSAANMFRLLRRRHNLTGGQIMSLLLFQYPVTNVVKQNMGELHSEPSIPSPHQSTLTIGVKKISVCVFSIFTALKQIFINSKISTVNGKRKA